VALAEAPEPVELSLPATPESVAVARHAATSYAEDVGADPDAVAVAVSEIVTNAIMHAYREREAGTVEVTADLNSTHMVIVVTDQGRGMGPNPDSPGLGFGLSMVSSLADEVGIESGKGGGTRLWMRFPLS
jgi:serine/threonine-protein kinase RsbW/stage II sporulation protein AB (anti-sigma F factor)